jgi:hypothetical protein
MERSIGDEGKEVLSIEYLSGINYISNISTLYDYLPHSTNSTNRGDAIL